jgi:hypothetical protein
MRSHPWIALTLLMLAACSPSLDWREVRPEGADLLAMFPCKPSVSAHPATPAEPVTMGLAQCEAAGQSFALSWAEVDDPAQVTAALRQMRTSLSTKLAAPPSPTSPLQVPGMTPNPEAQQQLLKGSRQQASVAVFTRGRRVYQAVMLGPQANAAAWDAFIGSLRLGA